METLFNENWTASIPLIIASGSIGTTLMTLFMYLMSYFTHHYMKVTKILGTMITFADHREQSIKDRQFSSMLGVLLHYLIGILFMVAYFSLWEVGIGNPDFLTGVLFGFLSGVIAVVVWYTFFKIHPNPPEIALPLYLAALFVAHFVFVAGCFVSFNLFTRV